MLVTFLIVKLVVLAIIHRFRVGLNHFRRNRSADTAALAKTATNVEQTIHTQYAKPSDSEWRGVAQYG